MAHVKEALPAMITEMNCETGEVTVCYCSELKEDGVSILAESEMVEMKLVGMDECLAKIAKAIAR